MFATGAGQKVHLHTKQSATRVGEPGPSRACCIPPQRSREGVEPRRELWLTMWRASVDLHRDKQRLSWGAGIQVFNVALGARNCLHF